MSKPILGGWVNGGHAALDLPRLLESRLLIQAASGGGKSYALRRLLEVTSGKVQQLIVDPDGEFASLREQHDLVIAAASGGDALAHPKTAALLATRLLETGVSAVLDIYDLKKRDRELFVQLFTDTLVNAPKSLWHSVMVVVDEAHMFCDESERALSTQSIIDLATRGRKRGLCLVAATQRISDFNKSAAAQLQNKLIGQTTLDVDVKRAAFELGKQPKEAMEMLRALSPGEFFAFGPAISPEIKMLKIGDVRTTHPKVGHRQMLKPPKPTAAIKSILPKLADLPKEAEEEARTVAELRAEVTGLKREIAQAKREQPAPVDPDVIKKAEQRGFERGWQEYSVGAKKERARLRDELLKNIQAAFSNSPPAPPMKPAGVVHAGEFHPTKTPSAPRPDRVHTAIPPSVKAPKTDGVSGAAAKILAVLSQFPEGCTAGKLALLAGYSYSGGFRNALSELRTAGLMEGSNTGTMRITPEGEARGPFEPLPTGDALLQYWLTHPSLGGAARKILFCLSDGAERTADELVALTGYEYSGGFRNALSELRTAGVLVGKNTDRMRISPEVVP